MITLNFDEVLKRIYNAKKGVEVRYGLGQGFEYCKQFADEAQGYATNAKASANKAEQTVAGIEQTKTDAVQAVQNAQSTATTAVTTKQTEAVQAVDDERDAALQQVADSTRAAQTAANAAGNAATAASGSASAAATSESNAASSAQSAGTDADRAEAAAALAGTRANTDKTLKTENAPADAAAVGNIILDPDGNAIFYSKAEVEAKIKEILAAQRKEDLARIKFWVSDDPTSPASFIGGTWERIEGKFIMGASETYQAGSTGGEAEHTLTEGELPNITGNFDFQSDGNNQGIVTGAHGVFSLGQMSTGGFRPNNKIDESNCARQIRMSFGSNSPHNNIPPYYSMFIWRSVAWKETL